MTQKIDKKELKSPDAIQKELQKGFKWSTEHSQMLLGAGVLVVLVWGGLLVKAHFDEKAETEIQAEFFKAEKSFMEKKDKFNQAMSQAATAEKDSKSKDKASKDAKKEVAELPKATGDLAKDFGSEIEQFAKIIETKPKSKAAQMAALHAAQTQLEYGQFPAAEATLKKVVETKNSILSGLLMKQLGISQANQNNCQAALQTWQKVLANSEAKSLHADVKLNMGLCYEALKDFSNAEKMYTDAKTADSNSATSRSAEKYLKLIQTIKK